MTNLDAPGYRLREDLRAAAQALIAQRQRTARRRKRLVAGFTTAALLAGGGATAAALLSRTTAPAPTATVSTASSPSPPPTSVSPPANARAQMSVFASAPPSAQQTPKAVTHALDTYARNPGQNLGAITAPPRLLASVAHAAVYAAPTDRGYVCFALWDGDSAAGSCAQNLTPEAPISAITGQASSDSAALVAGVASDAVVSITAVSSSGPVCEAPVTNNGFICEASGTGTVTSFLVHLRDGKVVTVPF